MQLTILGASPACQNPGGACSGYLLQHERTNVLIDCGSGVFGRLQQHVAPDTVQAVIISHMHADHVLDLVQYRYFLFFGAGTPGARTPGKPILYLPPGGHQKLLEIISVQDKSPTFFSDCFAVREYDPATRLQIGELTVDFIAVVHIPHTYGMRISSGDATFAYSADSGPCEGLHAIARESDLFLCECANLEGSTYPYHLTPRQAGTIAQDGKARRLVLTHRWWAYGQDGTVAEARECYRGPVDLAREDMRITIEP
jgi:ribonuclease BN (tRNA processing enzyme)